MSSKFKTDVKNGGTILIYKDDYLKKPFGTVHVDEDPEDIRGMIWDVVQRAYNAGVRDGRAEHAKELRALLNEDINEDIKP